MGKRGRRRSARRHLQSRRGHAARKSPLQQSEIKDNDDEKKRATGSSKDKWTDFSLKEIIFVFTTALALVGIVQGITDTLDVIDRIIHGYRVFYASLWRTSFAWLPNWVKPFDAQQTFDALTVMSLVLAATIGKKSTSRKYELYDVTALAVLTGIFQAVTIRVFDRTWVDIAATTTVNLTLLICCLILSGIVEFRLKLSKSRRTEIQLLIGVFVFGTLICAVLDSPRLVWGVIRGELPSNVTSDLETLRRVVATAFILTLCAVGIALRYNLHRPKRPIIAVTLSVALVIWGISTVGGVVETALYEAGIVAPDPA